MHPQLKRAAGQLLSFVLVLLLVITVVALKFWQQPNSVPHKTESTWTVMEQCALVPDRNNDGDSFCIRHGGHQYVMRLYFADCPEKNARSDNRDRMLDQGRDFGGATIEQMENIGQLARERTLALLNKPFRVTTKWERVYDSERFYAFVDCQSVSGKYEDLCAILVRDGLARVHTKGCDHPNGLREEKIHSDLRASARDARKFHRGAWSR